jgi:hypothetical protein
VIDSMLNSARGPTVKIEAKTGTRRVKHVDRFGVIADRIVSVVEVWIDGICLHHECESPEQARAMVVRMSYALGLDK